MDLVLRLAKLDLLPPALENLLDSELWGAVTPVSEEAGVIVIAASNGSPGTDVAAAAAGGTGKAAGGQTLAARARSRRYAASNRSGRGRGGAGGGGMGGGFLRSVTQLIALQVREGFSVWALHCPSYAAPPVP